MIPFTSSFVCFSAGRVEKFISWYDTVGRACGVHACFGKVLEELTCYFGSSEKKKVLGVTHRPSKVGTSVGFADSRDESHRTLRLLVNCAKRTGRPVTDTYSTL